MWCSGRLPRPFTTSESRFIHLSSELKEANPDIPWFKIAGMRHRLVHDYESTNWMIVAQTVLEDIPAFLQDIEHVALPRSPEE